ncbi:MAG: type II secretion system protein GspE [Deltaproteobacteria bacterium]|nr:type II secretion system ATPase GspE [Deltaproteobacteria bacterium]RLA89718.1 MAG: type II secretion system protein GspE [Deltaproteobacteria bacterium]
MGLAIDKDIEEALIIQQEKGGKIGEILIKQGIIKEEELSFALAIQFGLPFSKKLDQRDIDPKLIDKIPIHFAKQYQILPLREVDDHIIVAISNPINIFPLDDLTLLFNQPVYPIVFPSYIILSAINRLYDDKSSSTAEQIIEDMSIENLDQIAEELEEPKDLLDISDEAPIIRLVNSMLFQAVKRRASDIHIEPFERELVVRYRIDGILYNVLTPPKRVQNSIISRVKIMAGMDIAERRLPQDGRIRVKIAGRDIDIRVSVIPTTHGERVVMRLLDKTSLMLDLDDIGLSGEKLELFSKIITRSNGIILVTGPTGSGKTTTLYAALNRINFPDKNIITVEDPIEYQIKGIGQMQVNPKINLTFASGLRSILRQDPDVIMVGEIRDTETAEIAIQASLTGHLVFSTLHTNDAAGAVTRLLDMGIEPFLVSSSVCGILAQRLVRVLCDNCRIPYNPSKEELTELGLNYRILGEKVFFKSNGCSKCMGTGFKGRTGIFELFVVDDEIQPLIMQKADSNILKKVAIKNGMTTLKQDGAEKVIQGITTVEEVLRVTQEEYHGSI